LAQQSQRIYSFKSVRNFRDFGGYTGNGNQALKSGMLFRSAHFSDTLESEMDELRALSLGLLVDLRHHPERRRQPNRIAAQKDLTRFELIEDSAVSKQAFAPHEMFLKERLETAEDSRNYMIKSYGARPHDPVFIDIFSRTLKYMANNQAPLVIHCAAGKDRTGTLAAIIHKTLGVGDDDIMEDYMLTMKAVDIESFLEPASKFMSQRFERKISPDALRPMFGVEPAFLKSSLEAIGDFEIYLKDRLNIDAQDRTRILKNYLTG